MAAADLIDRWRSRAKLFQEHADESVARAHDKCAAEHFERDMLERLRQYPQKLEERQK